MLVLNWYMFLNLSFQMCYHCIIIRVATAQGKQGIWRSIFPDRETQGICQKTLKIHFYTGNLTPTQGKFGGEKKNSELAI